MRNPHVVLLRHQASAIAEAGINGWGNTMAGAADEIERLERIEKASREFFAWFNKNYPLEPSNHPDHPWCAIGGLLVPNEQLQGAARSAVDPGSDG